jgi:hypothetical protein
MRKTLLGLSRRFLPLLAVGALVWCFGVRSTPAYGGVVDGGFVQLHFDTELIALDLTGGPFPMPLGRDPNNVGVGTGFIAGSFFDDSIEGFAFVDSFVQVELSSMNGGPASLGQAWAYSQGRASDAAIDAAILDADDGGDPRPIDPNELHGQQFFVDSFFDVFFDITVTDVDDRPGRDYAGQADGASFTLPNNGPAQMWSSYQAIFDKDAPNFGLIPPPEIAPYIGHFLIEIPLGADLNGNGENDKIKFTLVTHQVNDENRTFIQLPDGSVRDTFDTVASLEGLIVDESTDPPFTIGGLTGPTTATSTLLNQVIVPLPAAAWLGLGMLGGLGAIGKLRRRKHTV